MSSLEDLLLNLFLELYIYVYTAVLGSVRYFATVTNSFFLFANG